MSAADGAPGSFEELLSNYHKLVISLAIKAQIPPDDVEDAAQNVELRFWQRGGMDWFDGERLFDVPQSGWRDGREAVPRTAHFAGMFRRYVALSMRGERDRCRRWYSRHLQADELPEVPGADCCEEVVSRSAMHEWVGEAVALLREAGDEIWAEALVAASEGRLDKREDWAEVLGCKVRSVAWAQEQLGARLTAVGVTGEQLRREA